MTRNPKARLFAASAAALLAVSSVGCATRGRVETLE